MTKRLIHLLLSFVFLAGCAQTQSTPAPDSPAIPSVTQEPSTPWWKDAVFYEIFVRSFYDTDGNGIGDFNGVTQKLDYLKNLGVTAIWLMPIHPSPSYHGYDVLNYYEVNPEYGTIEDFRKLVSEAHERDLRIIVDLVLNHTSSEHPFFVEANQDPKSSYRDWYIWSETPQGKYWHQGNNGYYFGFFQSGMPDLNYRNPDVTTEMEKVVQFWLNDVGIDGFRLDAAKHLIEEDGKIENTQSTHDWYRGFYEYYKSINSEAYTVGEIFGSGAFIAKTYENQFDHIFNFEFASGFVSSARTGTSTPVNSAIKFALNDDPNFDFATFLTNHDQDRVMSVLDGNVEKSKVAATLLLTGPGTPYIYYGEEIGMQGRKPDEDIRLPMQWSAEANAGFSIGRPWRAPNADFAQVNVAAQEANPDSLLNHYRILIQLRGDYQALRRGDVALLETDNSGVYAILRQAGEQTMVVLVNLSDAPVSDYSLTLKESKLVDGTFTPRLVLGPGEPELVHVRAGKVSGYKPIAEVMPYQSYIFLFE